MLRVAEHSNITHWAERIDLAAAFRWTERLGMHEAVAIISALPSMTKARLFW